MSLPTVDHSFVARVNNELSLDHRSHVCVIDDNEGDTGLSTPGQAALCLCVNKVNKMN